MLFLRKAIIPKQFPSNSYEMPKFVKNMVYFTLRKRPSLEAKYRVLNLKCYLVEKAKMGWTIPAKWQTCRRQASIQKTKTSLQRQSQDHSVKFLSKPGKILLASSCRSLVNRGAMGAKQRRTATSSLFCSPKIRKIAAHPDRIEQPPS